MGAIVSFNYAAWIVRYPEFAMVNSEQAAAFFNEATVYCRNDGGGSVADANTQLILLNALTAHIAALSGALNANGQPTGMVGRIASATQGSVSVATDIGAQPATAAWFMQTPYGASYWQMTAQFRSFRYRPPMRGYR